ncbi:MAG: antitoxin Xre/MbcA/ParS toxin-binding domain-containing protein, partial [Rhodanobacteraceae bacterium]
RRLGDGLTPLQLLDSDFGARKVEERLYQIGYGMFA